MNVACLHSPLHSHCIIYHWAPSIGSLYSRITPAMHCQHPQYNSFKTMAESSRATYWLCLSLPLPSGSSVSAFFKSSSAPSSLFRFSFATPLLKRAFAFSGCSCNTWIRKVRWFQAGTRNEHVPLFQVTRAAWLVWRGNSITTQFLIWVCMEIHHTIKAPSNKHTRPKQRKVIPVQAVASFQAIPTTGFWLLAAGNQAKPCLTPLVVINDTAKERNEPSRKQ